MKQLLFFFLLGSFVSNAQLRDKSTIEIIPEIGYSSFVYGQYGNYSGGHSKALSSANFGIAGDYYFNNRWSLRSGLLFPTMGGISNSSTGGESTLKLNYLNIPINANWHFGSTRKWNLNFGLTPSFLLSAHENDKNVQDIVKSAQLGLSFGIGYKLEISKKFSLLFDYQEFDGLTNIDPRSGGNTNNFGYNFNLGAVFNLK